MRRFWIIGLLFATVLMACGVPAFAQDPAPQTSSPSYRVAVRFRPLTRHGGPLVTVRLNNKLDATFLVDTGCYNTVITQNVAKQLGLKTKKLSFPGQGDVEVAKLDNFIFGGFTTPIEVMINDGPALTQINKVAKVDGILGISLLERFATLFDFDQQTLTLIYPASLSASAVRDEGFTAEGQPLEVNAQELYTVRTRINDKEIPMLLDTGGFRTFIPKSLAQGEGVRLLGENYSVGFSKRDTAQIYAVKKVSVGNLSWNNLSCYMTSTQGLPDALLGMDILSHSRLLIDFPGRRIYFAPQTTPNLSSLANQQQAVGGAIFGPTAIGSFRIFTAEENGEFYRAGLRPGDTLVSVNQNDVSAMLPDEITQEIIRSPLCRVIVTRREGEEVKRLTFIVKIQ